MKTQFLALVVILISTGYFASAQTLEIWMPDPSTGNPVQLTGNQVSVPANTQLYLRARNIGLPPGTNPNRRYEFFWDMGNGKDHRLSSNQIVTYQAINGRIKPRLVLKGIYTDEDLRVVNANTEVLIGNGLVGAEVVILDDTKWIEIEQLNDLRNSRLVSYHLKYSNRYNPDGPDSTEPGGTTITDRESPEQTSAEQATDALNPLFDRRTFDATNLSRFSTPELIDRSVVERALDPSVLRTLTQNNAYHRLVNSVAAAAATSSPAFQLTYRFPKSKLEFYGIDMTTPDEPMLLKVGSNLAQLISLDTTSNADTGIISIEAIGVGLNEERQILLTFLTKAGLSQNAPVDVFTRFEMSREVLDVLNLSEPPSDSHTGVVGDSHDPNAKTVYPSVFCKPIPFEYKIHFENEGFAEANRIWIVDSIDGRFDFSSLSSFDASPFNHLSTDTAFKPTQARTANITIGPGFAPPDPLDNFPMSKGKGLHIYKDETNRKIVWVLDQIDLPHPALAPQQTQGWVSYSVELKSGTTVAEGEEIYTPATIYFDSNDPISTLEQDQYTTIAKLKKECPKDTPWYLWLILLLMIVIVLWLVAKFVKRAS